MERLKVAFCDDDDAFRASVLEKARRCFEESGLPADVAGFPSGTALAAAMEQTGFRLIFLDIDMPGTDGIRLGEALRQHGCAADIIYVSNLDDRVYEIFPVHPWSFIRKSRLDDELPAVVEEYARFIRQRTEQLVLQGADGTLRTFGPEDIVYVEAAGKTQKLVLAHGAAPFSMRCPLHELEGQLLPFGFIRIHKGFMVNYRYIRKITSRSALLDTGAELPVGRDRLKDARERYLSLMKWRGLVVSR